MKAAGHTIVVNVSGAIMPVIWTRTTSVNMFPVRCCIIVPMNAKIAIPTAIKAGFNDLTQGPALYPNGEISTMSATICSQKKGTAMFEEPKGTL